jgi:hypothetical protein
MTKPIIREHNIETGQVIDREMTDAEFEKWQLEQEIKMQRIEAEAAKVAQRQAILDRLGLTAEEAALLLS